jgi:hypothetical protein
MLQYWLAVLLKTFWDSLRFIDKSDTGVAFAILVLMLTAAFLVHKHGWRGAVSEWKKRLAEGAMEGVVIAIVAFAIVCMGIFLFEPHHLQEDEVARKTQALSERDRARTANLVCRGELKGANGKVELLSNQVTAQQTQISGQQTLIVGQQNTASRQQSTFDLCVATLAQTNAPVPFKTTMLLGDYAPFSDTKHTAFMLLIPNRSVTPARVFLWCDARLKHVDAKPFGVNPYFGSSQRDIVGKDLITFRYTNLADRYVITRMGTRAAHFSDYWL